MNEEETGSMAKAEIFNSTVLKKSTPLRLTVKVIVQVTIFTVGLQDIKLGMLLLGH